MQGPAIHRLQYINWRHHNGTNVAAMQGLGPPRTAGPLAASDIPISLPLRGAGARVLTTIVATTAISNYGRARVGGKPACDLPATVCAAGRGIGTARSADL